MLEKIITYSVKNKLVVGLFIIGLVCWGGYEVTRLPIDAVPDITDNQVQVITVSPSLGAPDIERLITFPIEQSCNNIPGLKQIRSFSRFGLSLITVVFEENADIYWARQQISERLQQVKDAIPSGIGTPEMAPVTTGLGEIYQYAIRAKEGYENKYDAMELRTLQDWVVRRQLLGTPGVADVSSFGGKLKQYEIAVRPEKLKAYNTSITEVFDALEKNNQNTGGAYIEKGPKVLYIRSEGLTTNLNDIENVVVRNLENGTPLLIKDIAQVRFGSAVRYGAMTFNDKGEVAGAVVMMLKGENSSAVVKRIKEKIAEIQKGLPEGVVIEPFLDRTKMVNHAINTVETNLTEGALIVIFVLVFFLGNLRAGLIVASVIPLSMLFAVILMNYFGIGGNLMSLGAIDFGIIVDGSVIVVEAILHRFAHSKHFRSLTKIDQLTMDHEVHDSTNAMIRSAVFSQIIILIVYFPILSLQGIEGKMFKPMAYTVAFAVIGAFLLSITYVPMICALLLSKKLNHKPSIADRTMGWLERIYQPLLGKAVLYPRLLIVSTLALFAGAIYIMTGLGGEFIPELEEGDFAVETRLLTGSNLNTTIEATQKATKILLRDYPEVEKVVTKIGSAEIPTDPMPFEAADMMVILKDKKEWTSAKTFDELSQKMTRSVSVIPGITVGFQFPVQMRFNELMTGARQDVVCKIFGEDLDTLSHYAHRLSEIIGKVDGAINIYEETVTGMPQIVIHYNREAMAKYGINVSDINRIVNTAFAGQSAGMVYEGEKRFDLTVRLEGEAKQNIADVRDLLIPAAHGVQIPLRDVASVEEVESVNQIQRENTRRRIIVGFNVSGRDVQTIVDELKKKVDGEMKLPLGYSMVYGGSFENMNAAKQRLAVVVPIALLLIFLLLYFAFNSIRQGLLIYSAIPLSATGGILSLWIRDMPFSISAGVGFIALFGVAVLNGILLVSEFNKLHREGWHDIRKIVTHATKSKLRAVLMTALVPSLGFIPMAISTGAGGEVQKPLATVVIGGLIISTLLTLFVLPVLYILFEKGFSYFKFKEEWAAPVILALIIPMGASAQTKIDLQHAVDQALKNNAELKSARMETEYYKALRNSYLNIDKTNINYEAGKINSIAADNKLTVSQPILFPSVYKSQKAINEQEVQISRYSNLNQEVELAAQVKYLFYQLLILERKKRLLEQADSLYTGFISKAQQKFKAGDIDILEMTTAENQRMQIRSQLNLLETDQQNGLRTFRFLLNTTEPLIPATDSIVYAIKTLPDTLQLERSPLMLLQNQKIQLGLAQVKLEKSRMLPELNLSYNNMSIAGWQKITALTEKYFNRSDRFIYYGIGVGVPVFYSAQKAKIKASNLLAMQTQSRAEAIRQQLRNELANALQRYRQTTELLQTYTSRMMPNAQTIISAAESKLQNGEINYLDWVMLVNQSFEIQNQFLAVVQQRNESIILIEKISAIN